MTRPATARRIGLVVLLAAALAAAALWWAHPVAAVRYVGQAQVDGATVAAEVSLRSNGLTIPADVSVVVAPGVTVVAHRTH